MDRGANWGDYAQPERRNDLASGLSQFVSDLLRGNNVFNAPLGPAPDSYRDMEQYYANRDQPVPPAVQQEMPESKYRPLTLDDIGDKSEKEIALARNEIYARHGRTFNSPEFANHFNQKEWYRANPNFKESDLSAVEQRNILFLHSLELDYDMNGQRNAFKPEATVQANLPGSLIADSSHRQLTDEEIAALKPDQVRLAINEINARHGLDFKSKGWKDYFNQFSWYKARTDFSQKDLSWLEERNIEKLKISEYDRQIELQNQQRPNPYYGMRPN